MRRRPIGLLESIRQSFPHIQDPEALIAAGRVRVDGIVRTNPASLVRPGASVVVTVPSALRGEAKLRPALESFGVDVRGRVALDVGAAAGGFTKVLLEAGARRVYAVDAGHGQLLGSLRQDPRVVNLEATNLGELSTDLVPEPIEVFTVDVSYLSLALAVPQLNRVAIAPDADLVGLVKPMFELHLAAPPKPSEYDRFEEALERAIEGIQAAGWSIVNAMRSPVLGGRGAIEMLVHAQRAAPGDRATIRALPGPD